MSLILTWAILISFIIIAYVLLDGFDLGIGILFPWVKDATSRDIMMSTVAPVWDGNETWLVFGAAALYGAFPVAYGALLPMIYMPIMIMLIALIFRGLAFEFRFKAQKSQWLWDISFSGGSAVAAMMQGIILGSFVQGYGYTLPAATQPYPLLTPFSFLTGIAVVAGYALLGATWLILKTEGKLQLYFYRIAKQLLGLVTVFLMIVCVWTPFLEPSILQRWFSAPSCYFLLPLPIITSIAVAYNFYFLSIGYKCHQKKVLNSKEYMHDPRIPNQHHEKIKKVIVKTPFFEKAPFILSLALFCLSYIGFCISVFPYIVPRALTFWEAAAPASSLKFTLVGTAIILPILLCYTIYSYSVFRGKVTQTIHY